MSVTVTKPDTSSIRVTCAVADETDFAMVEYPCAREEEVWLTVFASGEEDIGIFVSFADAKALAQELLELVKEAEDGEEE